MDREAWKAAVQVAKSWRYQSDPTYMLAGFFLASGSSVPVGIMHVGGVVAWITGALAMLAVLSAIITGEMCH